MISHGIHVATWAGWTGAVSLLLLIEVALIPAKRMSTLAAPFLKAVIWGS